MEIKSTEIQAFLLQLMQALRPLTEGEFTQKEPAESKALTNRIFVPPQVRKTFSQESEVRILPVLQTAQKQMRQWNIESAELPARTNKMPLPSSSGQSSKEPSPISLAQEAKSLVILAIQMLSSSSNLDKPEEKALRSALSNLKPFIDQLITAVGRKEMGSPENRTPPSTFRPLPKSPREHLLKKLPLPAFKESGPKPLSQIKVSHSSSERPSPAPHSDKKTPLMSEKALAPSISPQPRSERTAPFEPPAIAPYTSEKPLPEKPSKKKKKKKSLWDNPRLAHEEALTSDR